MGAKGGRRRARGATQTLLVMGGTLVCSALLLGCADKPTYEADYDQNFPFGQLKTTAGMTTITIPEKVSTAAATAVTNGCAARPPRS